MSKVKIRLIILGHVPYSLDIKKIQNWDTDLFEIVGSINSLNISGNSDGAEWEFLDKTINSQLPSRNNEDILIAVTNVPLENKYFVRRFSNNRICMTFNTMTEILKYDNIPLENLLLRILYTSSIIFKRFNGEIPLSFAHIDFIHDETKGCLFDMNGIKSDVIYSLNKPQLCHSCVEALINGNANRIESDLIDKVQKEIKKIKKSVYFQLADFVKNYPIFSIIISSIFAIFLGITGSISASFIWENI